MDLTFYLVPFIPADLNGRYSYSYFLQTVVCNMQATVSAINLHPEVFE